MKTNNTPEDNPEIQPVSRRQALSLMGSLLAGAGAGNFLYRQFAGGEIALGQSLLANDISKSRLVIIILEGGLDGMTALFPYGDPDYLNLRGDLAIANSYGEAVGLPLTDMFWLHPSLCRHLFPLWQQGHLAFAPSLASAYRGNNHQDARLKMQTASGNADFDSGWLARLSTELGANLIYDRTPLIEKLNVFDLIPPPGAKQSLEAPPRYDELLSQLFDHDDRLATAKSEMNFFHQQLASLLGSQHNPIESSLFSAQLLPWLANMAGTALVNSKEWRIAVISAKGFDTHFSQGTTEGILPRRLAALGQAIGSLRVNLDSVWHDTLILTLSEFGRSIQPNSTHGTDHGQGGLAILAGGMLKQSQIIGAWPGLKVSLDQGRGLLPTVDSRNLLMAMIKQLWNLPSEALDRIIPGPFAAQDFPDLFQPKSQKIPNLNFL